MAHFYFGVNHHNVCCKKDNEYEYTERLKYIVNKNDSVFETKFIQQNRLTISHFGLSFKMYSHSVVQTNVVTTPLLTKFEIPFLKFF